MNDRIKELIKHTDIWCDQNVASESPTYNNQWEYKFAELIIQECARVARATPAPITPTIIELTPLVNA